MNLLTVSISHNTAPAECFERFACSDCDKEDLLHKVKLLKNISESFVIATCNRLDVTVVYSSNVSSIFELGTSIINEICLYKGLTTTDYIHFFKRYSGEDAVTQIFRVTCGLDSALLGETEIAGQMKMAYKYCCREKSCGFLLNKLFHSAFRTAKAVKSKTEFNSGAVSVAYAAVKWIRNETAEIRIPKILIIGAGKMAELAIKHLLENEINNITVLNRTDARAESLSALYKIDYKPWHNLSEAINNCDAVIAAVSSPSPIFNG
ncbi:MAG: glutamyl-tRNA reductase, partial [Fibrobacteres bacterium]|nr:glutamyl-tRNA reductase [Fibrobacterota bacterium]